VFSRSSAYSVPYNTRHSKYLLVYRPDIETFYKFYYLGSFNEHYKFTSAYWPYKKVFLCLEFYKLYKV